MGGISLGQSGGSSGGGGGLLLRVPPDEFSGATRSVVNAARDAAITNVPSELAQFDANPNLAIILAITGTDPDTTVYQVRRGGAWADSTNTIRGPKGQEGPPPSNAQIDARVRTVVADEALDGNTDRWPLAKVPAIADIMSAIDSAIGNSWRTGGGGGGGSADGVVSSGRYDVAGQNLVLTISTGGTVTISLAGLISSISSGGGGTPVRPATLFFGTSVDRVPAASELTIPGVSGDGEIPAYAGARHVLVARLASEADIARVVRSDDVSNTNQIGGFSKAGSTVNVGGNAFAVWVSNQALTQSAAVTWSAS